MLPDADEWWLSQFGSLAELPGPVDYRSRDGKTVVEAIRTTSGTRGLYAAALELAIYVDKHPHLERACLVLGRTHMTPRRIEDEWNFSKAAIRPEIASRLAIIVIEHAGSWVSPDQPFLRQIAAYFERKWIASETATAPHAPGQKIFEVIKVLLNRWLRREGPIGVGHLAETAGCSYPTVRKALDDSMLRNSLRMTSSRSVELQRFPHDAWSTLVALSPKLRKSIRFVDRSGDKPSPQNLVERLERRKPANVAIGGVVSARYWHPDFDLNGMPRLDLLYHSPDGRIDFDFVREVDPALEPAEPGPRSPVMVIHPLVRAMPLFVQDDGMRLPLADPVETALDLNDLSLGIQANKLLSHLRPEVRLA